MRFGDFLLASRAALQHVSRERDPGLGSPREKVRVKAKRASTYALFDPAAAAAVLLFINYTVDDPPEGSGTRL